jgi:hypothetical protein
VDLQSHPYVQEIAEKEKENLHIHIRDGIAYSRKIDSRILTARRINKNM